MKDPLKQAVRNMATTPFDNGQPLKVEGKDVPYEISNIDDLSVMIRVHGVPNAAGISSGPRYFEVRIKEKY